VAALKTPMRQTLQYYYNRPEVADSRSNWGQMHSVMVYGRDTKVQVGRTRHSTIAWIAGNNLCRGKRLLKLTPDGISADNGVGLQGHQGQFLMVLGLSGVPKDYPLYASGKKFSVEDLVRREARTCHDGEELTFSLIGLAHYFSTDETWVNEDGEKWNFERLLAEELSQPIVGAACGGSHRLMGFAHALRMRRLEGLPIDGQWRRAKDFLDEFVDYTYRLQNRDGSMSTAWFEKRDDNGDVDRKIQTTGHMVEWLLTYTPDDQLQNPRLVAAIRFLTTSLRQDLKHDWSIGPKGHALRSLAMYYDRVFGEGPAWKGGQVARSTSKSRMASRPNTSRYRRSR
ncbi:MAG: GTPase-activating protein, partial [Planctomycetota bacterium]